MDKCNTEDTETGYIIPEATQAAGLQATRSPDPACLVLQALGMKQPPSVATPSPPGARCSSVALRETVRELLARRRGNDHVVLALFSAPHVKLTHSFLIITL